MTQVSYPVSAGTHTFKWVYSTDGSYQYNGNIASIDDVKIPIKSDGWTRVAAGGYHTVAVKGDGTLWAGGYNGYGQLGDGPTTQRNSPIRVGSDTNWVSVAAGFNHTVGLKSDGTLWAWGNNVRGQVGPGRSLTEIRP